VDAFADDLLDLNHALDEFASRHPRQVRVKYDWAMAATEAR
jgi:hypothetical protein